MIGIEATFAPASTLTRISSLPGFRIWIARLICRSVAPIILQALDIEIEFAKSPIGELALDKTRNETAPLYPFLMRFRVILLEILGNFWAFAQGAAEAS